MDENTIVRFGADEPKNAFGRDSGMWTTVISRQTFIRCDAVIAITCFSRQTYTRCDAIISNYGVNSMSAR